MLKRLRRMWTLSSKDPEAIRILESLTEDQIRAIPEDTDEKAEFFGNVTDEEMLDFERSEKGLKPWYDLIKRL